ncbi:hypothetical protein ILUMI_08302, partial [Ignelater luminosus]
NFTLHKLFQQLEEDDDINFSRNNNIQIAVIPPTNACDPVTDEELITIDNLPSSQLRGCWT